VDFVSTKEGNMQEVVTESRRSFLLTGPATLGLLASAGAAPAAEVRHRRVVTGTGTDGKSRVVSDGRVPQIAQLENAASGNTSDDLWVLPQLPADLTEGKDPVAAYTRQPWPSRGGLIARMFTWKPGFTFPMHKSSTIDFVFILSGKVEMMLDEGSVTLGPGDCLVQRGTNHGWRVTGDEPCTLGAVIVSAAP
jgi:quercetin dioxygenase-like cupin family protein